ncbi:MAG: glycosyltransferase [Campylobacteraceae bacterium]|nr:glycosyltransferase [Campylobacteraceae bacterium]
MFYIDYEKKTIFTKELEKNDNISKIEKNSFLSKIKLKKKSYANVYFYGGLLNSETKDKILNCENIIVSSLTAKKYLTIKVKNIDENKIQVIYPSINETVYKKEEAKESLSKEFTFDKKAVILFFTAKNFRKNGAKEFITLASSLNYKNKQIIIAGSKEEIVNLKFLLPKKKLSSNILFLEDYNNISKLFAASDIFLFPSTSSSFSVNVLKAMFHKNAVFISSSSSSSEIADVYSTMNGNNDGASPFKIDALLARKSDLKLIQNENAKKSKEFILDLQIHKFIESFL